MAQVSEDDWEAFIEVAQDILFRSVFHSIYGEAVEDSLLDAATLDLAFSRAGRLDCQVAVDCNYSDGAYEAIDEYALETIGEVERAPSAARWLIESRGPEPTCEYLAAALAICSLGVRSHPCSIPRALHGRSRSGPGTALSAFSCQFDPTSGHRHPHQPWTASGNLRSGPDPPGSRSANKSEAFRPTSSCGAIRDRAGRDVAARRRSTGCWARRPVRRRTGWSVERRQRSPAPVDGAWSDVPTRAISKPVVTGRYEEHELMILDSRFIIPFVYFDSVSTDCVLVAPL